MRCGRREHARCTRRGAAGRVRETRRQAPGLAHPSRTGGGAGRALALVMYSGTARRSTRAAWSVAGERRRCLCVMRRLWWEKKRARALECVDGDVRKLEGRTFATAPRHVVRVAACARRRRQTRCREPAGAPPCAGAPSRGRGPLPSPTRKQAPSRASACAPPRRARDVKRDVRAAVARARVLRRGGKLTELRAHTCSLRALPAHAMTLQDRDDAVAALTETFASLITPPKARVMHAHRKCLQHAHARTRTGRLDAGARQRHGQLR